MIRSVLAGAASFTVLMAAGIAMLQAGADLWRGRSGGISAALEAFSAALLSIGGAATVLIAFGAVILVLARMTA